eukprot:11076300-Alexandrium_andersonii.AAC.2
MASAAASGGGRTFCTASRAGFCAALRKPRSTKPPAATAPTQAPKTARMAVATGLVAAPKEEAQGASALSKQSTSPACRARCA